MKTYTNTKEKAMTQKEIMLACFEWWEKNPSATAKEYAQFLVDIGAWD